MKTLKYIFRSAFLILAVSLVSCGGKDDNNDGADDGGAKMGWTENGDTMTYRVKYGAGNSLYDYVWTFKFNGDSCTQARCSVSFPTAAIVQAVYAALNTEEKTRASISGKTITLNYDGDYLGMSKSDLKAAINAGAGGGWL